VGKAIAYLILVAFGALLLRSTGLLDGMFDRGNLKERDKFWRETVAREVPDGNARSAVVAFVTHHGMSLECFHPSIRPPIEECVAEDPNSKGGPSVHPLVLNLRFTFQDEKLAKFETGTRALK